MHAMRGGSCGAVPLLAFGGSVAAEGWPGQYVMNLRVAGTVLRHGAPVWMLIGRAEAFNGCRIYRSKTLQSWLGSGMIWYIWGMVYFLFWSELVSDRISYGMVCVGLV